jgi:hypothetical protein
MFWRAEYETNRGEPHNPERATITSPNHDIFVAGLFQDEQVKDARRTDKYPFLLLFFKWPSTPPLPNSDGIDQQSRIGRTFGKR